MPESEVCSIHIGPSEPETARPKRDGKRSWTSTLVHAGPAITTTQAKRDFIPEHNHDAFDKAANRAASKVRSGQVALPVELTGGADGWQLVALGTGGHHGAHMVSRLLSRS